MGKSKVASRINNMTTQEYMAAMGGSANQLYNSDSGINQPTNSVYRYFNLLRDYTVNRYSWQSNILSPYDLQLIEWLFFHTGRACLLYPTFYAPKDKTKGIKLKTPSIYNTNITLRNMRTGVPLKINVINNYVNPFLMPMKIEYTYRDFAMLSCNYTLFEENNIPWAVVAWEYANKLYEIDLTFNANATKQRIPLIFNNGDSEAGSNKQDFAFGNFTVADLIRDAMNRNEQFTEIPESKIGDKGVLHNTNQYNENNLNDYLEAQRKILDEYLELIGIEGKQEKHGVYESEAVQLRSLGNNNYKSLVGLRNRRFHAERANERFGLDLRVQQLEYQI